MVPNRRFGLSDDGWTKKRICKRIGYSKCADNIALGEREDSHIMRSWGTSDKVQPLLIGDKILAQSQNI